MIISKEALVDLQEKYEKYKKILETGNKLDTETDQFLSAHAARNVLLCINANLENLLRPHREETLERTKLIGMLAATQLHLGIVSLEMDETSVSEKHLNKCKEIVDKCEDKSIISNVALNMFNQLGLLWSKRDGEKAKEYMEDGEKFYNSFKASDLTPVDPDDLYLNNVEDKDKAKENFEKLHTLTLYYLAQIYGAMGDSLKSSIYCHNTLRRQLECGDYDPIDWALNSASLSQFFTEKSAYKQARHHLAASSYILDKYQEEINLLREDTEENQSKRETLHHRSADVARCWAKYGLLLLTNSKERLLNDTDDIETNCPDVTNLAQSQAEGLMKTKELQDLYFPTLDIKSYELKITDKFILTLQDAHKVFLNIQSWLRKAHGYYTIDAFASDYIEIVEDQCQMYECLVFFEDNIENQAKLYKRGADLLENVVKRVNPAYYMQYCRKIWNHLGHIYTNIFEIKMDKMKEQDERPTPHAVAKINTLTVKAINNFRSFVDSFRNTKGELPKSIEENAEKPFLQAHFHIAALSSKYITLDKSNQLENCKKSLDAYLMIAEYCKENPKASESVQMELSLVNEMVKLIPIKILKLQNEISGGDVHI